MVNKYSFSFIIACLFIEICPIFGQIRFNDKLFNFSTLINPKDLNVPDGCDLLPVSDLKRILNIPNSEVTSKSTQNPGEYKVNNCFYKWNDPNTPHAGILFQILTNPIFEDNPFYVSDMMSSKINDGDNVEGLRTKVLYKELMVGKVKVIYAHGTSRCYWNIGENYLFTFAFNMNSMNEQAMLNYIRELVPIVNKNFISKMLE